MNKLPRITGKQMIRFLGKQGFVLRRVRGSHHILAKGSLHVPVPVHGKEELRIGTMQSILRMAEIKAEDFERLWNNK